MSLHDAREDLRSLLNKGYKKKTALDFVCNHYAISKDDRNLLTRTTYSNEESESIKSKEVPASGIGGKSIAIDTYNVIITMESVLYGDPLVCDDGVIRDDRGVFGKYVLTERTNDILSLLSKLFCSHMPMNALFYIDKQVSHSAELATKIHSMEWCVNVDTILTSSVDHDLKQSGMLVATADSAIIKYIEEFVDLPKYFLFHWG